MYKKKIVFSGLLRGVCVSDFFIKYVLCSRDLQLCAFAAVLQNKVPPS